MLEIRESRSEVVVREKPFLKWMAAFSLTYGASFIVYFVFSPPALWTLVIAVAVFLGYLIAFPSFTVKIDRQSRIVSVRRQSLIKYDFKVFGFDEIDGPLFVSEGTGKHQLIMNLKDGRQIALSAAGSKGGEYHNAVQIMNDLIYDAPNQIPFRLTVFEDD